MGSAPRLSASHSDALSSGARRSRCGCRVYLLDMAGHRVPRQATRSPAATMTKPPTTAAGRHGMVSIVTWPVALTPGVVPPGTAPGVTPPDPPAVADPAWETVLTRAAASTSAVWPAASPGRCSPAEPGPGR